MSKDIIKEIVEKHDLVHISTIGNNNVPNVRGVDYAMGEDESVLYFITGKDSAKVKELEANNNVAIVIDHPCHSMEAIGKLKYIKGTGKAYIGDTPEKNQKAFGKIIEKFPYLKDLPGDPSDFVGIRVELHNITLVDNTKGFGYTEEINYR